MSARKLTPWELLQARRKYAIKEKSIVGLSTEGGKEIAIWSRRGELLLRIKKELKNYLAR